MFDRMARPNRRAFLKSALSAAALFGLPSRGGSAPASGKAVPLFDGKTLAGWTDIENSATAFSGSDISDLPALAVRLNTKADPLSRYLDAHLDDTVRMEIASPITDSNLKPARNALARNLTRILSDSALYDDSRFQGVTLGAETRTLLALHPHGRERVHLNRLLLEDAFPALLRKSVPAGWMVKDGVIASTGAGRGVLCTTGDYARFRLRLTMRHVSGDPDHQACVLIFCTRPAPDELPLDALGGIQFQVPLGGHWDYRPGQNNAGDAVFTRLVKPAYDPHEWSRVEILADASSGTARMAVAQPVAAKAVEVLDFKNPAAGKSGPIALQMHNAGLFDEYKDLSIEIDPPEPGLITVT